MIDFTNMYTYMNCYSITDYYTKDKADIPIKEY
jgi:hypothetical protein